MSSRLFVSRRLPGFQHRLLSRRFRPTKAKKRTQQRVVVVVVVFGFFAFLSFSSSQVVSSRAAQGEWMSSRQNILETTPLPNPSFRVSKHFFLWLKVGFLVKCMASRLQTNNELSSLFQRKKSVPNFRAKNHDATARDVWLRCRRRRLSRSERRRCPRDKTRRPAGVARCAILVFSFFFSFSFPRKKEFVCVGEFWLRFVSRGYFLARCGGGRRG